MGILIPISLHVNTLLRPIYSGLKPEWAATEKELRAIRYVNAFNANTQLIRAINGQKDHAKPGV